LASWRFNEEELTAKNAKNAKHSEKATNQTAIPHASVFIKATALQNFRVFSVFCGQEKS